MTYVGKVGILFPEFLVYCFTIMKNADVNMAYLHRLNP
jgi:hypothetical protein